MTGAEYPRRRPDCAVRPGRHRPTPAPHAVRRGSKNPYCIPDRKRYRAAPASDRWRHRRISPPGARPEVKAHRDARCRCQSSRGHPARRLKTGHRGAAKRHGRDSRDCKTLLHRLKAAASRKHNPERLAPATATLLWVRRHGRSNDWCTAYRPGARRWQCRMSAREERFLVCIVKPPFALYLSQRYLEMQYFFPYTALGIYTILHIVGGETLLSAADPAKCDHGRGYGQPLGGAQADRAGRSGRTYHYRFFAV